MERGHTTMKGYSIFRKELRESLPLGVLVVGACLALLSALLFATRDSLVNPIPMFILLLTFSIAQGAVFFARENQAGTCRFVFRLSVSRRRIVLEKCTAHWTVLLSFMALMMVFLIGWDWLTGFRFRILDECLPSARTSIYGALLVVIAYECAAMLSVVMDNLTTTFFAAVIILIIVCLGTEIGVTWARYAWFPEPESVPEWFQTRLPHLFSLVPITVLFGWLWLFLFSRKEIR